MSKAIALFSGGLDSILSILLVLDQGWEINAVSFVSEIGCVPLSREDTLKQNERTAQKFGFSLFTREITDAMLRIVRNPSYGHGKNLNPCLDCKITMLQEARNIMEETGADCVVTGEVVGQRPMSQQKSLFPMMEKKTGLKGRILRPLSALLLPPTIPEQEGLIDRYRFCGFAGRSRKPQMELAERFGVTGYPQPAGGCLLTDPLYTLRLRDILLHIPEPSPRDLRLLQTGRRFRVSPRCVVVAGRNERENEVLMSLADSGDVVAWTEEVSGPVVLVTGHDAGDFAAFAASVCARYSSARVDPAVSVMIRTLEGVTTVTVAPAKDDDIRHLMITA